MNDTPEIFPAPRETARVPTHPGELMREILEEHLALSAADAAQRMAIGAGELAAVLDGRDRVTPAIALRFGRLANAEPTLYLHMQTEHDLALERRRLAADLARIAPAAAAGG